MMMNNPEEQIKAQTDLDIVLDKLSRLAYIDQTTGKTDLTVQFLEMIDFKQLVKEAFNGDSTQE